MPNSQLNATCATTEFLVWWGFLAHACAERHIPDPGFKHAKGWYEDGESVRRVVATLERDQLFDLCSHYVSGGR